MGSNPVQVTIKKSKVLLSRLFLYFIRVYQLNRNVGRRHGLLINRELIDLKEIPLTEKDLLEGIFVYILTLDDEVSDLLHYLIDGK